MQLIYAGKTERCLPKFEFPKNFDETFNEKHSSNTEISVQSFNKIIFLYIEKVKKEKNLHNEQMSLISMDTFVGQDNDTSFKLWQKNNCVIVIVPPNLTNRFQPLDITFYITIGSLKELQHSLEVENYRIVKVYNFLLQQHDMIIHGFESACIIEAIDCAHDVTTKVENPFKE